MTIDECIDILSYPTYYCPHLREKALDMAIDTLRKYQNMQEIVKDIPYGGEATVRRIQEVIEDGKEKI